MHLRAALLEKEEHPPIAGSMGTPTITVVIPAHNAERFLPECLASVRTQISPATETILVDDASADGTHLNSTVRLGLQNDLTFLRLPDNRGPAAARMAGVQVASSDWIAFLDADDRWLPSHLDRLRALMRLVPDAGVVCSSAATIGQPMLASSPQFEREVTGPVSALIKGNFVVQSAVAVRREVLLAAGGYDRRMRLAEDYELWMRLAMNGVKFVHSSAVTCLRHEHAGQATARMPVNLVQGAWDVRRRTLEQLAESGDTEGHSQAEAALVTALETDLQAAWARRSRSFIQAVLEATTWTEGRTHHVRAQWLRRVASGHWLVLYTLASVYDRLPRWALGPMRQLRRKLRSDDDQPGEAATT